mgnify:CR=1 FL=1|tara:strand:+ start:93 stop:287 length:195 start_codon:yes stop_codon:yes gene_type:complete
MILDIIIMAMIIVGFYFSYKFSQNVRESLREIYGKFDTIYYMLCDILRKRHERQVKKNKRRINE